MVYLTKPDTPYGSWPVLIQAALDHAFTPGNMNPGILAIYANLAAKDIMESFAVRPPDSRVRPSSGINCAAMPALVREGEVNERPGGNPLLFATGHFHHNLIYAALHSALPKDDFKVLDESEIALPEWWPEDTKRYTQEGHRDLRLEAKAEGWLAPNITPVATFDVKTKHGLGMSRDTKKAMILENDTWGNLAQLATYTQPGEAGYILYSNREIPSEHAQTPQFKTCKVWADDLDKVRDRVRWRVRQESRFYPELWMLYKNKKSPWKGYSPYAKYCNFLEACKKKRIALGFEKAEEV